METVFPANGNRFFIEYFIPAMEMEFLSGVLLFRVNVVLLETIIQVKVKPLSYHHFIRVF